MVALTSWG